MISNSVAVVNSLMQKNEILFLPKFDQIIQLLITKYSVRALLNVCAFLNI